MGGDNKNKETFKIRTFWEPFLVLMTAAFFSVTSVGFRDARDHSLCLGKVMWSQDRVAEDSDRQSLKKQTMHWCLTSYLFSEYFKKKLLFFFREKITLRKFSFDAGLCLCQLYGNNGISGCVQWVDMQPAACWPLFNAPVVMTRKINNSYLFCYLFCHFCAADAAE